jgi:hypothetical protein
VIRGLESRLSGAVLVLLGSTVVAACGAEYDGAETGDAVSLGTSEEGLAAVRVITPCTTTTRSPPRWRWQPPTSSGAGKYMAVGGGSTIDGALVDQEGAAPLAGADQWRLVLSGTKHQFINVRSGKCLTLSVDGYIDNGDMVQRTCTSSTTQVDPKVVATAVYTASRRRTLVRPGARRRTSVSEGACPH